MAKIKLTEGGASHYLEIEYTTKRGKVKTKRLPLSDSFTLDDSMSFVRANNAPKKQRDKAMYSWCYEYFCRHLGRKFVGSLTTDQVIAISKMWAEANERLGDDAGGATLGES